MAACVLRPPIPIVVVVVAAVLVAATDAAPGKLLAHRSGHGHIVLVGAVSGRSGRVYLTRAADGSGEARVVVAVSCTAHGTYMATKPRRQFKLRPGQQHWVLGFSGTPSVRCDVRAAISGTGLLVFNLREI